jgi:hypothetical protein
MSHSGPKTDCLKIHSSKDWSPRPNYLTSWGPGHQHPPDSSHDSEWERQGSVAHTYKSLGARYIAGPSFIGNPGSRINWNESVVRLGPISSTTQGFDPNLALNHSNLHLHLFTVVFGLQKLHYSYSEHELMLEHVKKGKGLWLTCFGKLQVITFRPAFRTQSMATNDHDQFRLTLPVYSARRSIQNVVTFIK